MKGSNGHQRATNQRTQSPAEHCSYSARRSIHNDDNAAVVVVFGASQPLLRPPLLQEPCRLPPASGALQAAPLLLLTFSPSHLQAARNLGFPTWVTCKEKERRVPLGRHPEKQEPKCADFSAGAPATIETFYLFSEHDIFQWVCIKQNSC